MNQMIGIRELAVLDTLKIHDLIVEPQKVKATYTVISHNGDQRSNSLIYSYDDRLFDKKAGRDINLASMMVAQVALNYGLFFRKIIFDGLFDPVDKRFLNDMMENTSREILVLKFFGQNEFLKPPYDQVLPEKLTKYTNAELIFENTAFGNVTLDRENSEVDLHQFVILSSGGKDSLLTYGVIKELGEAHPVFINESGRHWFTAVNAYRHFKEMEPNTRKPWCNSDRIFNWMIRQLPFIKDNFQNIRADIYPIRLWTVSVFLFGVLPIARQKKVGNILIGNEYDTTIKGNYQGISHYHGLYDQSKYFDNALSRYFHKKGWNIHQYSILRSLSELLILKILVKRYPNLQRLQVSCHAAHEKNGRMLPCGNCEKCRRIIGMLKALDEDPQRCGYTDDQIAKGLEALSVKSVKQIGSDAAHLYQLLLSKGLIADNEHTRKLAKTHPEIVKLRFDNERSKLEDLPKFIRKKLITIYSVYAEGIVQLKDKRWQTVEQDEIDMDVAYFLKKASSS
jgi:hypothetical protein